jgi:hypothetical protein
MERAPFIQQPSLEDYMDSDREARKIAREAI